eukprot:gene9440-14640_t
MASEVHPRCAGHEMVMPSLDLMARDEHEQQAEENESGWTSQLILVKRGCPQHVYPKVIDLNKLFRESGKDRLLIGRSPADADITLPQEEVYIAETDPTIIISRRHCYVTRVSDPSAPGGWLYTLEDNAARNGTFLNWKKLGKRPAALRKGDLLCFGGGSDLNEGGVLPEVPFNAAPPCAFVFHTAQRKVSFSKEPDTVYSQLSHISYLSLNDQLLLYFENSVAALFAAGVATLVTALAETQAKLQRQQQRSRELLANMPEPEPLKLPLNGRLATMTSSLAPSAGDKAAGHEEWVLSALAPHPDDSGADIASHSKSDFFSEDLVAHPRDHGEPAATDKTLPHDSAPKAEATNKRATDDMAAIEVVVDVQKGDTQPESSDDDALLDARKRSQKSEKQKEEVVSKGPAAGSNVPNGNTVPPKAGGAKDEPQPAANPAPAHVAASASLLFDNVSTASDDVIFNYVQDTKPAKVISPAKRSTQGKPVTNGTELLFGTPSSASAVSRSNPTVKSASKRGTGAKLGAANGTGSKPSANKPAAPGRRLLKKPVTDDADALIKTDTELQLISSQQPAAAEEGKAPLLDVPLKAQAGAKAGGGAKPGRAKEKSVERNLPEKRAPPKRPQSDGSDGEPPAPKPPGERLTTYQFDFDVAMVMASAEKDPLPPPRKRGASSTPSKPEAAAKRQKCEPPPVSLPDDAPGVVEHETPVAGPQESGYTGSPVKAPPTEAKKRGQSKSPLARPKKKMKKAEKTAQLPRTSCGFDLLCADVIEDLKGRGVTATRKALVKAWRNLDVAGKDAYEKRAAKKNEELIKQHPELALLNPCQQDEDARLLAMGSAKPRQSRDKATKMELNAPFDQHSDEATKTMMDDIEKSVAPPSDDGKDDEASHGGDTFEVDRSKLNKFVATEAKTLKEVPRLPQDAAPTVGDRLLGTRKGNVLVLPKNLADLLKNHQMKGVQFLWKNLVALPDMLQKGVTLPGGCIVAHGMGLGKTLTSIAFILMWNRVERGSHTLIIAPKSTLRQWVREFEDWCEKSLHDCPQLYTVEGIKHAAEVREWGKEGGVLIVSYAMFVRLMSAGRPSSPKVEKEKKEKGKEDKDNKEDKEDKEEIRDIMRASQYVNDDDEAEQEEVERAVAEASKRDKEREQLADVTALLQNKTDLVFIDEGHKISSPNSAFTKMLRELQTMNRIVLTGTPLQSSMKQYHTMIDFVRPDSWSVSELSDLYTRASSDPAARAELAHSMQGFIQRFDCRLLREELPPLTEYAIYTKSSNLQRVVYSDLMTAHGGDAAAKVKTSRALAMGGLMLKLCNHTTLLKDYCKSKGVVDPATVKANAQAGNGGQDVFDFDAAIATEVVKGKALYTANGKDFSWATPLFEETHDGSDHALRHNPKTSILLDIVQTVAEAAQEKIAVFCDSTAMLDVMETYLQHLELPKSRRWTGRDRKASGTKGNGMWRRGIEYHRLDGTCSVTKRQLMCDDFNKPRSRSIVFLISTRAGGLGINLTGATRVVLYGASWNAQSELQAIYRTYRYGQTHPVTVYRLISQGTIEQTIFARSAAKMRMAAQFLDDKWSRADLNDDDEEEEINCFVAGEDSVPPPPPVIAAPPAPAVPISTSVKKPKCAPRARPAFSDVQPPLNFVPMDIDIQPATATAKKDVAKKSKPASSHSGLLEIRPTELNFGGSVDILAEPLHLQRDLSSVTEPEDVSPELLAPPRAAAGDDSSDSDSSEMNLIFESGSED